MSQYLPLSMKLEFQQHYRRFQESFRRGQDAQSAYLKAKSSRIWILGLIAMFFAFHSTFYLGMAAAFIGTYLYQMMAAYIKKTQIDDTLEDSEHWFNKQGLCLQDDTVFFRSDDQLENPLDLYDDGVYQ